MVMRMNNENITKALVLYNPPKQKNNQFVSFLSKSKLRLFSIFSARKKLYISFFALHLFSLFFSCTLNFVDFGFFKALSAFICCRGFAVSFVLTSIFLFFTGFTIFGKFFSVLFQLYIGFFVGIKLCESVIYLRDDLIDFLLSLILITVVIFITILSSVEVYRYSSCAYAGKSSLFLVKPLFKFFMSELFLLGSLNLLYYFCW